MMKSLLAANRSEKDSFRIPHSVQQSMGTTAIWTSGARHTASAAAELTGAATRHAAANVKTCVFARRAEVWFRKTAAIF